MLKKSVAYLLFILTVQLAYSQKHDYQWLFGYENKSVVTDTDFGGVILDFNNVTPQLYKHRRLADFKSDNVSYSDNDGHLLFYSNGGDVFDRRDSVMLNGDSINYGDDWNSELIHTSDRYGGLSITQGMLVLPAPGDTSYSYLYHYSLRFSEFTNGPAAYLTDTFYYSLINLSANNGLGYLERKNQILNADTLAYSELSAVQHGNGRDWWIIHPYYNGNCYYKFILNDTTTRFYEKQCIGGSQLEYGAIGSSCFSPNGEKYFWVNSYDGIHMFDFDRCTGDLSNPQIIPFPFPLSGDTLGSISGIAVSPNNRFLYVAANVMVFQYDLEAPDIGNSVDTVAIWDGSYSPSYPYANTFFIEQLGPDGKIYINSTNGVKALSVINQPDKKGDSCHFTQHSLYLGTYNDLSMPNFPNYRLGALHGSACDTLSTMTQDIRDTKEQILSVFPNPGNEVVTIDYGFTDWNKGTVGLEISNALGQIIYTHSLPMYSGYQKLDISSFAAGIYYAAIKRGTGVVAVAKLVKQ